jgi:hypothetical protein
MFSNKDCGPSRQRIQGPSRGSVLVVALLMLLVMTILGLTAMNSSIMQGLMSTSYKSQAEALSDAENILRQVEGSMEAGTAERHYTGGASTELVENADWSGVQSTPLTGGWYVVDYIGNFLDELRAFQAGESESIAVGADEFDLRPHISRVTTRAEGSRGSLRIVQSVFATSGIPGEAAAAEEPEPEPEP